jgi:hypothetical protein
MVERSLSMREVRGSIPRISIFKNLIPFCLKEYAFRSNEEIIFFMQEKRDKNPLHLK